jgi:hypothetical protein
MHMFRWFNYYMWLTWHDSCDFWTLGWHNVLSLQDLSWWTGIHEEMTCLDLSWALEPKDGCTDSMSGERF